MSLQALIFDVDGTLANTEHDGHLRAFNDALVAANARRESQRQYAVSKCNVQYGQSTKFEKPFILSIPLFKRGNGLRFPRSK